jgi:hypothetical protein
MLAKRQIDTLKNVNIETVEKEKLVDVSRIEFNNSLSKIQRMESILELTKNPYCFRYDDIGVKLEFTDNAKPLQEVMTDFFIRQKSGM